MPRLKPGSPEDIIRTKAMWALYQTGKTLKQVGDVYGVSVSVVSRRIFIFKGPTKRRHRRLLSLPNQEIVSAYESGKSMLAIAKDLGVSEHSIDRRLRSLGVRKRNRVPPSAWVVFDIDTMLGPFRPVETLPQPKKKYFSSSLEYERANRAWMLEFGRARRNARTRKFRRHSTTWRLMRAIGRNLKEWMRKRGASKHARLISMLGCSWSELWDHLENQFKPGMTRENFGKTWDLDHVVPKSWFDHTDPEQVAECWHYTNLQPMYCHTNRHIKKNLWAGTEENKITRGEWEASRKAKTAPLLAA